MIEVGLLYAGGVEIVWDARLFRWMITTVVGTLSPPPSPPRLSLTNISLFTGRQVLPFLITRCPDEFASQPEWTGLPCALRALLDDCDDFIGPCSWSSYSPMHSHSWMLHLSVLDQLLKASQMNHNVDVFASVMFNVQNDQETDIMSLLNACEETLLEAATVNVREGLAEIKTMVTRSACDDTLAWENAGGQVYDDFMSARDRLGASSHFSRVMAIWQRQTACTKLRKSCMSAWAKIRNDAFFVSDAVLKVIRTKDLCGLIMRLASPPLVYRALHSVTPVANVLK